ncbi:hypothetical protein GF312_13790 [Candidatus Poribacteria bacterium]|nr:hypothetical protein [Candidatus Poribacteria bacterium]
MSNHPEKKFVAGGIAVTIWKNTGKDESKSYHSIVLEKRYKDKEGNWKSTNSLNSNDLPKARLVLAKAYEYLMLKDNTE